MDRIWSPWRYNYVASDSSEKRQDAVACVFCDLQSRPGTDADKYILFRGARNFIVLNLYPYTSGHVMVVPFEHTADLHTTPKEITDEMMDLTKRCQDAIGAVYKPDGFNLGMNQGSAAGAGVAGHIHMHVLPRWVGDANFVSTIGETRVLPEALDITYRKLKACFE